MKFEFHEEDAPDENELDAMLKQLQLSDAISQRVEEILRDAPLYAKLRLLKQLHAYRNTKVVICVFRNLDDYGKVQSITIQKYSTP